MTDPYAELDARCPPPPSPRSSSSTAKSFGRFSRRHPCPPVRRDLHLYTICALTRQSLCRIRRGAPRARAAGGPLTCLRPLQRSRRGAGASTRLSSSHHSSRALSANIIERERTCALRRDYLADVLAKPVLRLPRFREVLDADAAPRPPAEARPSVDARAAVVGAVGRACPRGARARFGGPHGPVRTQRASQALAARVALNQARLAALEDSGARVLSVSVRHDCRTATPS